MKKLFLLGVLFSIFLVSCDDNCGSCNLSSIVKRDYKIRDMRTGATFFESMNGHYKIGDTVFTTSEHGNIIEQSTGVIIDTIAIP